MKEATLYEKRPDGSVRCLACNWNCRIQKNKTGICGVRQNRAGKLILLVYGKAIAVNVDPMEKKPLYHFLPGSQIFSIGTLGCNFACDFCQNFDISQAAKGPTVDYDAIAEQGVELLPERIVAMVKEKKLPAIAYTYNEPTVYFEYAYDTAKLAHKKGIKNVFVSNGYFSDLALQKITPYLSAINIDLKSLDADFYRNICHARIEPVLENIKKIAASKIWLELTTLLIPGKNDKIGQIKKTAQFIAKISPDIPWHISAFFPCYKLSHLSPTLAEKLKEAYGIGKEVGLKYIYVGNLFLRDLEQTYCPKCKNIIIHRRGMDVFKVDIKSGKCGFCREKIAGIFGK